MQQVRDTIEDFEALPTVETQRPAHAGHVLVKRLGCYDGYDLYLGDKLYYGISRRSIIKTAHRRSPGYLMKRRRLVEEARIISAFRHPNLTALYDAVEDEQGTHLVFEHIDGANLKRASVLLRDRNEAFPFELCVWILTEVLRGMSYAHVLRDSDGAALKLVLRDLVPGNVLIAETGQVKLATFACSLVAHGDEARPHPGDAAYLAPERIARNRYDARADVYSAGVLLFELLYGRACFSEHRAREVAAMVVHSGMPLEKLEREGVPAGLIEVVERATERRPEQRYQSASSMARDLLRWLEQAEHHATPSTVAKFFDRQGLFEEKRTEKRVSVCAVLEEDATAVDVDLHRRTIDGEAEPEPVAGPETEPNETISALVIHEDPEPPITAQPIDVGPPAPTPTEPEPEGEPELPPASAVPLLPSMVSLVELENQRLRGIWTAISALVFLLSVGFLIFTVAR